MTESAHLTNPSETPSRTIIKSCRACTHTNLEYVLDFGDLVVSNFVYETRTTLPRVKLKLVHCHDCGLLQLSETTDPELLYRHFWYRSGTNETMRKEMKRLVDYGLSFGRESGTWLDIGANDGTLLGCLDPTTWLRVGYEPAENLAEDLKRSCDICVNDYYPNALKTGYTFDVITSAAMFYDLHNPHGFLEQIREDLAEGGVWINQLSYTPDMVKKLAFDNVCHEHLCYYNVSTLQRLLGMHGLRIHDVTFNDVNGGSMCCAIVHQHDPRDTTAAVTAAGVEEARHDLRYYQRFADDVLKWRAEARYQMQKLRAEGKRVHIYGASTKGNTLLQFCNFGPQDFEMAADRSRFKWGLKTAGTNIPIVSEETSRAAHPDAYLVLPWAFRDEFVKREAQYLANGGTLIFPLPRWEEIRG